MFLVENLLGQYNWRYAVRRFDPQKKLEAVLVDVILQSMVLSPSSFGAQPWKICVVEDDKTKQKMFPFCYQQPQVIDSSHVLVLCGIRRYTEKDIERYHQLLVDKIQDNSLVQRIRKSLTGFIESCTIEEIQNWVRNQVYIMLGFGLSTCAALGVDSCPMEGFNSEEIDKILGLEEHTSMLLLPLGTRLEENSLPKVRFDLKDVVFFHSG